MGYYRRLGALVHPAGRLIEITDERPESDLRAQHAAPVPAAPPKERCNHEIHERHESRKPFSCGSCFAWLRGFFTQKYKMRGCISNLPYFPNHTDVSENRISIMTKKVSRRRQDTMSDVCTREVCLQMNFILFQKAKEPVNVVKL